MDDLLGFGGLAVFLAGIYLWLGLAATLIILGVAMMYAAARYREDDNGIVQTANTGTSEIPTGNTDGKLAAH